MNDIAGSKFTRSLMGKIAYWAKMLNDYSEQGSLTISGDDLVSLAYTFAAARARIAELELDLKFEKAGGCRQCGSCGTVECGCTHRCKYALEHPDVIARIAALTTVTEDDVEAVARVLASFDVGYDKARFSDENWQDYTGDARAALAAFISRKGSAQPEAGTEPGERGNGE